MMKLVQEDYPLTWTEFDIRTDDEIHEKYMLMVPVVEQEGNVLLYGNIGYVDIIELFENNEIFCLKFKKRLYTKSG